MQKVLHPYTMADLQMLLEYDLASDEFRGMIEKALADGSEAAIRALGERFSVALPAAAP